MYRGIAAQHSFAGIGSGPEKKVDHDKIPLHTGEYQRSLSAVIRRVKHGLV